MQHRMVWQAEFIAESPGEYCITSDNKMILLYSRNSPLEFLVFTFILIDRFVKSIAPQSKISFIAQVSPNSGGSVKFGQEGTLLIVGEHEGFIDPVTFITRHALPSVPVVMRNSVKRFPAYKLWKTRLLSVSWSGWWRICCYWDEEKGKRINESYWYAFSRFCGSLQRNESVHGEWTSGFPRVGHQQLIYTRMHSSRMRTVRCRSRRWGGDVSQHALGEGVSQHALGRGCIPACTGQGVFTRGDLPKGGVSGRHPPSE